MPLDTGGQNMMGVLESSAWQLLHQQGRDTKPNRIEPHPSQALIVRPFGATQWPLGFRYQERAYADQPMNRPSRLAGGGRCVLSAAEVLGTLKQADASPIARPFAIAAFFPIVGSQSADI
jgi:hypothetical protein